MQNLHVFRLKFFLQKRNEFVCNIFVDQYSLKGVADACSLGFGIEDDFSGFCKIRTFVNKEMRNAFVVFQYGHCGSACYGLHHFSPPRGIMTSMNCESLQSS